MSLGSPPLLRTPLHGAHLHGAARMVDFAGWDMPVQYPTGIVAEHQSVRTACGVFDLSHMGRVFVRGAEAQALVEACCTRDLRALSDGQAAYSLLCLPDGGILDDIIVYRLEPREILLVVNASNREADVAWLCEQSDTLNLSVEVDDATLETALIGVQGPTAQLVLQPSCSADLDRLAGYTFALTRVADREALVARTGDTGEDGFEVLVKPRRPTTYGTRCWLAGAQPCGLGARDTLRTEAGFSLYGHEIDESTNPSEARLGWVVDLDKGEFVGRTALVELKSKPLTRRLVGLLVAQGGVPRPGLPILDAGQAVGALTSGTFSPTLKRGIGLGYVPTELSRVGQQLEIDVRGRPVAAEVTRIPFVPHKSRPRTM